MSKKFFYAALFALLFSMNSCDNEEVVFDLPEDPDVEVPDDDKDDDNDGDDGDEGGEGEKPVKTYKNPVSEDGIAAHTPFVLKDGEKFYAYCTQRNWNGTQGVKMAIFESADLCSWEYIGPAVNQDNLGGWLRSPNVIKGTDNKYYLYFYDDNLRCFVSNSPTTGFSPFDNSDGKLITNLSDISTETNNNPFISYVDINDQGYIMTISAPNSSKGVYLYKMTDYTTIDTSNPIKILDLTTTVSGETPFNLWGV